MVFVGTAAALLAREPWNSNRVVGSPNTPAPYNVERLHPKQSFENPVDLAFMPGSTRLFVAEQGGKLWSFDTRSNGAASDLAIDLKKHHRPFDNILGFTFHPGFVTNHFVFVNYNEPEGRPDGAHVSRFTMASLNPPVVDPAVPLLSRVQVPLLLFVGVHENSHSRDLASGLKSNSPATACAPLMPLISPSLLWNVMSRESTLKPPSKSAASRRCIVSTVA